jgi:ATP-dependent Lhr-like helicase
MELYAVFSSPQSYTVETTHRQVIGSLNQDFVDGLVDGVSCFLLGGRAWAVFQVVHKDRTILVQPAARGRQPTWGGLLPQFLGFHLCQKILAIVTGDDEYPYLSPPVADLLHQERQRMRPLVEPGIGGITADNANEVVWRTFAGGRINSTIRYGLGALEPHWTITPDNFSVRVRADGLTESQFRTVARRLRDAEFWTDETVWQRVRTALPGYRLSKFQPLMPPWIEQEVLFDYLLDRVGAAGWLRAAATDSSGA